MWTDARQGESGYSLVEVMVAIIILTVAILPIVDMFETALRAASTFSATLGEEPQFALALR